MSNFIPPAGTGRESAPTYFDYPPQIPGRVTRQPSVTTPTFPATTVDVTNSTGVDVLAYINNTGVTATATIVGGTTIYTTAISGPVFIPAGAAFSQTYSAGTPTWVWVAA